MLLAGYLSFLLLLSGVTTVPPVHALTLLATVVIIGSTPYSVCLGKMVCVLLISVFSHTQSCVLSEPEPS